MLTIGQLAAYAGVTVRAVRHYHQVGLLPEPERDASGYRQYGATAAVSLIKIRILASAGVPLAQIGPLLEADAPAFAAAVEDIDRRLRDEIERLETSRRHIGQLTAGDSLVFLKSAMPFTSYLHVNWGRAYYLNAKLRTQVVISAKDDPRDPFSVLMRPSSCATVAVEICRHRCAHPPTKAAVSRRLTSRLEDRCACGAGACRMTCPSF